MSKDRYPDTKIRPEPAPRYDANGELIKHGAELSGELVQLPSGDWVPKEIVQWAKKLPQNDYGESHGQVAEVKEILRKGRELRAQVRQAGPVDWLNVFDCYVGIWQELMTGVARAKRAKKVRSKDGKERWATDEVRLLAFLREGRACLDSLVGFRDKLAASELGVPPWLIDGLKDVLKDFPEAREKVIEMLSEGETGGN